MLTSVLVFLYFVLENTVASCQKDMSMLGNTKKVGITKVTPSNIRGLLDTPSVIDCPYIFMTANHVSGLDQLKAYAADGTVANINNSRYKFNFLYRLLGFIASPIPFIGLIISCFTLPWYLAIALSVAGRLCADALFSSATKAPFKIRQFVFPPKIYLYASPAAFTALLTIATIAANKWGILHLPM